MPDAAAAPRAVMDEGGKQTPLILRSEKAQEIISKRGGFIEQWALLVFGIILSTLVAGTWFVRYPDIIHAQAKLTAENAPKEILPLQAGRLIKLMVNNGSYVHKNQILGYIESTANTENVLRLSAAIDSSSLLLSEGHFDLVQPLLQRSFYDLGELQNDYQTFISAFQQYNDYYTNGFFENKKNMLLKDIAALQAMKGIIHEKKQLTGKDRDSARVSLEMNRILLEQKVISAEEYRNQESKFISKQMALPQYRENLIANETQQRDKRKEIDQIVHDEQQQLTVFRQALQTFKSSVDEWLHRYVLRAPIAGKMVYTLPLQQNKYVEAGKVIAFVNPDDSKYYVEIQISQNNFGKVDTGMQVQLRFDAYPFQETGYLPATIDYLSPMAIDTGFLATARLNHGLMTNLNKQIQYKNGLNAQALIITRDMRLLERIFYNLRKTLSPNK